MLPKLVIATLGNTTNVFLEGKQIGKGVENLVYSARDNDGNLNPTLKLLEVNVNGFSLEGGKTLEDFLNDIGETREKLFGAGSSQDDHAPNIN